jgi:hypothetical protein
MRTKFPERLSLAASHDPATKSSDAVVQTRSVALRAHSPPPQNKATVIFKTAICAEPAEGIKFLGHEPLACGCTGSPVFPVRHRAIWRPLGANGSVAPRGC